MSNQQTLGNGCVCDSGCEACDRLGKTYSQMRQALNMAQETIRAIAACGSHSPRFVAVESQIGLSAIKEALAQAERVKP